MHSTDHIYKTVMANTYSKLYIHLVLVVKGRDPSIPKKHKTAVQEIMADVIEQGKHQLIEINCMPDHTHILLILRPRQNLVQLVDAIKDASKTFVQSQPWMSFLFDWQDGFGAFSCSHSVVDIVAEYIRNQEEHHKKRSFREEYMDMLRKSGDDFEGHFLFDFYSK